jgi:hypothetical protein
MDQTMSKRTLHVIIVVLALSQLFQWAIIGIWSLDRGRRPSTIAASTVSTGRLDIVDSEGFPVASLHSRRTTYTDANNIRHTQDEPVIELGTEGSLPPALALQDDAQRGPELTLASQKQDSVIKLGFDDAGRPSIGMGHLGENGARLHIGVDKKDKTLILFGKESEPMLSLKLDVVNPEESQVVIWSKSKQPVVIKERK